MAEIVLATLNAKYIHAAFGLRCLLANLDELRTRAALLEFDINQRPLEIAEQLLAQQPGIVGLGVYIWNVTATTEVVSLLKRLHPDLTIILGGPEVSYEWDAQPIVGLADYVITGEADQKFAEVCRTLLAGDRPAQKIIPAELPDLGRLAPPYPLYNDQDVAHRIIYVEASRGCPFTCEFCLSSLDIPVRQFPLPPLLQNLEELLRRGVRQFKFVDRTFNLNLHTSRALLQFFLERNQPGLFVHFEMIPDRLPAALREIIARFPPGALQFEVGIQTFNPQVAELISRRQDYDRLADNFQFLRKHTGVHLHADLIVGLPGESIESFGQGFDRLVALRPQEIQIGILKRLRGTPIVRHDAEWQMVYSEHPPYEILQTKLIDFPAMQGMRRFARFWDLIGNSGNFVATTPLIWRDAEKSAAWLARDSAPTAAAAPSSPSPHDEGVGRGLGRGVALCPPSHGVLSNSSPFAEFNRLTNWLYERLGRKHAIALAQLGEALFDYLTTQKKLPAPEVAQSLWSDYQRGGRTDTPPFLRPHLVENAQPQERRTQSIAPRRQARHLAV